MIRRSLILSLIVLGVGLVFSATTPRATATPPHQFDDPLVQGEYLSKVLLCVTCHTPPQAQYNPATNPDFGEEEIRTLALFGANARDNDRLLSGGVPFDLGPEGIVFSRNLTPHETGLGDWTDDEIKTAIRTGVNRDGRRLHPIMDPLTEIADADLDALVMYLRSLTPVENDVPYNVEVNIPGETLLEGPIIAPDPSDQAARGEYLVSMMHCSSCHTPIDLTTGAPLIETMFLAGRQPFEEVFGTVYAGNITPDDETGLGDWSADDLKRAMTEGIRIDGRRLGLMPWQDIANLTLEDLDAIVYYLQNEVAPVENSIPATNLNEAYIEFVEIDDTAAANEDDSSTSTNNTAANEDEDEENDSSTLFVGIIGAVLIVLVGGAVLYQRRKSTTSKVS